VLLPRKELKKAGQLELVKLFPRLVSKGLGRGESGVELETVISEAVDDAAVTVLLDGATIVDSVEDAAEEEKDANVDVDDKNIVEAEESPACRRCRSTHGAGRRSMRISPFLANCASVYLCVSLPMLSVATAVLHSINRKSTVE